MPDLLQISQTGKLEISSMSEPFGFGRQHMCEWVLHKHTPKCQTQILLATIAHITVEQNYILTSPDETLSAPHCNNAVVLSGHQGVAKQVNNGF